jgi:hypothetical protein
MDDVNGKETGNGSAYRVSTMLRHGICRWLRSLAGGFSPGVCIHIEVTMWRVRRLRWSIEGAKEKVCTFQQFPLSFQAQRSLCRLHWPFVNIDAKISPDWNDVMFS